MTLYRKVGRRYVPTGELWSNPKPGVWIVSEELGCRSQRWFMHLGDPQPVMHRATFERYRDVIGTALAKVIHGRASYHADDLVSVVLDAVAQADAEVAP